MTLFDVNKVLYFKRRKYYISLSADSGFPQGTGPDCTPTAKVRRSHPDFRCGSFSNGKGDRCSFSIVLGNVGLGYSEALELLLPQNKVELQLALLVHFRSVAIRL